MKKTLRRIIPLMLLAVTAMSTTGCSMYTSKADKKENMVGLYELEIYKAKHNFEEEEPYDRKADEGIVAYFTLDMDGYGYYGYKDNVTAPRIDSVFSTYIVDDDDKSLYKSIDMTDNVHHSYEWEWKVGCLSEPPMGFRTDDRVVKERPWPLKDVTETVRTFSYTIPQRHNNIMDKDIYYQYVSYKRIGDDTGYAKIAELLGISYSDTKPFEMKKDSGYYVYRCQVKDQSGLDNRGYYEYAILDMDSYNNGNLTLYYSLKSNPGRQTTTVPVSIVEKGRSYGITWNNHLFSGAGGGLNTSQSDYSAESLIIDESFTQYWSAGNTLEQLIELERTPSTPYLMHRVGEGEKQFVTMSLNEQSDIIVNGLELAANEEFVIFLDGGIRRFYEDLADEESPVVQGSVYPEEFTEVTHHHLKVSAAGSYDIRVDREQQKVHVSLAS